MPLELKDLNRNRELQAEEVAKVADVIEETGADETPYPHHDNEGNMAVIGNPNITKREPQKYLVLVYVDKKLSPYTEEELKEVAVEMSQTELEYHVVLEVPVDRITIDKREAIIYAISYAMSVFYDRIENEEEGTYHYEFITDKRKRTLRTMEIINDKEVSAMLKQSVVGILDLPEGLQTISVSQALETIIDFMINNPDLVNEADANLN